MLLDGNQWLFLTVIHYIATYTLSLWMLRVTEMQKKIKYLLILFFCLIIGGLLNDFVVQTMELGKIIFIAFLYFDQIKIETIEEKNKVLFNAMIGYIIYCHVISVIDVFFFQFFILFDKIDFTWVELFFLETISLVLTYIFINLIHSRVQKQLTSDYHYKMLNILLSITYTLNIIYLNTIYSLQIYSQLIGLTIIIITGIMILTLYLCYHFGDTVLKYIDEKLRLQHINDLEQYTQDLEKNQINLRRFKHDYKNLIIHIEQLVAEQKYDALKNYLAEIHSYSQTYLTLSHDYSDGLTNIKIDALKNIILNKLLKMESKNIPVYLECLKPVENVVLSDMDTVRIFGVLLDNAIESLEIQTNGKFEMLIISEDDYLEFELKNTVEDMDISLSNLMDVGYSTKAKDRGIGLASVKQILTKYPDIELDMVIENQWFIVSLIIPKG